MQLTLDDIAASTALVVKEAVRSLQLQIMPVIARLDAIEAKMALPVEKQDLTPIEKDIGELFLAFSELPDVDDLIAKAIADLPPTLERLDAIEAKLAEPPDVEEEDLDAVKSDIESLRLAMSLHVDGVKWTLEEAIARVPATKDGKDADPEVIRAMVEEAVAAIPPAQDGKDADPEQVAAFVTSEAERILAGWERPQDGKSVTVEELVPVVEESVQRAVAAIPVPKDGPAGQDGLNGKDGIGLVSAFIDNEGGLAITATDGSVHKVGIVVGKDGAPGLNGKDGADGLGFEDMDFIERDDGFYITATKGGVTKERRMPIWIDRGVWKEGAIYRKGDGVTWAGSFFIAQGDDNGKPESPGSGWRMAVKRGRDGKDGK